MTRPLVQTDGLCKRFPVHRGRERAWLRAVDDVDLSLWPGEAVGLVGESGSGKSTVARLLLHLLRASDGVIRFDGEDVTHAPAARIAALRREMQIVFQDPHASLNPRMTIFRSIAEPLVIHERLSTAARRDRVAQLLDTVGLSEQHMYRYPHELSGGQKQRVCIARAVALNPRLLVLDEPTSALDVSVQAQTLAFLKDLQTRLNLTYLFISHNLAVIRHVCPRVAVMYLGRIVEEGATARVFDRPKHPYTQALLDAVPLPQARQPDSTIELKGDIPSPVDRPSGCPFQTRCQARIGPICAQETPQLRPVEEGGRVACHLYQSAASEAGRTQQAP